MVSLPYTPDVRVCDSSPLFHQISASDHSVDSTPEHLAPRLTSNRPALESEVPLIHGILSSDEACMHALDAQMHALLEQIQELYVSRTTLAHKKEKVADHARLARAAISSVRRVPAELICEIFVLAVSPRIAAHKSAPPWWLGHICRSWRQAALSYSLFWSSLSVPSALSPITDHLSRIEAQLIRAAHAPLYISWRDVQNKVDPALLHLVLPHCSRWRSLCFDVYPKYERRLLNWLQPVNGQLKNLQKLEVIGGTNTSIPDVFSNAPNLQQVVLADESFLYSPSTLVVPWVQITHYQGTYKEERQLEILRNAPNLLECSIGFINFHNSGPDSNQILPHLRRLCIEDDKLLRHLTAPMLEALTVVWFSPGSLSFVQRSSCTLKKLALMRCTIDSELTDLLQNIPSLTHLLLSIDEEESDEDADQEAQIVLFSEMSIPAAVPLCPKLTTLVYGYVDCTPWDPFFAMVKTRLERDSAFSLRLFKAGDLTSYTPDGPGNWVVAMQDADMDVKLLDHDDSERLMTSFCSDLFSLVS
ncbi:hypothetical protein C8R47DRAFT_209169 [Mycena vitilis]|nr:hypothetical protein C8R47DRAFT_209169 [Mycena vitilis]